MKVYNISVQNEGYISCKSSFYSAQDSLSAHMCYTFSPGINKLIGEIDSGNWAISYLLSMYQHRPEDFILFEQPQVAVNTKLLSLNEFSDFSCYMDSLHPLFSNVNSVKEQVDRGLRHSKSNYTCYEIKDLFHIDNDRYDRPLNGLGNESFKAMAAIGFAYEKEVFCFPWLSNKRFESYHKNLTSTLQILKDLDKTVILPTGILSWNI